ncbi:receptor-like protein 2 [Tripterygium wilfordii]|uniref:receptor-like protein 2 n=1 Tax=Tripterygium wilfordii TaxID=458696 RepID=UPI0018F813CA|nr:receptor-like protein 2 [Tripterygium wilfordii]
MSHLYTIDLFDNQFNGPIPPEFCTRRLLVILDLSGNNLSGSTPPSFSELGFIEHVHLRRNKLSGPMTQFLGMTDLINLGENNFSGQLPNWIGNFSDLGILILRANQFHGDIPIHLCNLNQLNILDLSSNSLSGRLPPCLSNFLFISGSNLWYPFELGQFTTFNNSCYEGNPLLCGLPLSNNCDETHSASPPTYPLKEENGFMDMTFFWVTFAMTYTVALFGVVIVLTNSIHKYEKYGTFEMLDESGANCVGVVTWVGLKVSEYFTSFRSPSSPREVLRTPPYLIGAVCSCVPTI